MVRLSRDAPTATPSGDRADEAPSTSAAHVTVLVLATDTAPAAETRLERVLDSLDHQTRRPDAVLAVAAGCSAGSTALLRRRGLDPLLRRRSTPADAVRAALAPSGDAGRGESPSSTTQRWLWILTDDVAAEPGALEALLAAVELRPQVAVAGPKVRDWDAPRRLLQAGLTTSRRGRALTRLDVGELDQGQVDQREDVLAVATGGMLVRQDVLAAVGGFDPVLPADGADVELCRRVRLAGHGVVVVPAAVVMRPERAAAEVGGSPATAAHRRLVMSPRLALPVAYVAVLADGVLRVLWRFLVKDPAHAPAELGRVLGVVLRPDRVVQARRRGARSKRLPLRSLDPLLASGAEVRRFHRERWSVRRELQRAATEGAGVTVQAPRRRRDPVLALVLAVVLLLASLAALRRLLGPGAITAPALPAAPPSWSDAWAAATSSWSTSGGLAPPDPMTAAVAAASAVLGGSPAVLVVVVLLGALPLAGLSAWWASGGLVRARGPRLVAALVWASGAPLLAGVTTGRLGPVVAHVALPWLAWALLSARRARSSRRVWAATGQAALALVVVGVGSPVLLVPAAVVLLLLALTAVRRLPLLLAAVPSATVAGPWFAGLAALVGSGSGGVALAALVGGPVPPAPSGTGAPWQLLLGQPLDAATWAQTGWGLPAEAPAAVLGTAPLLMAGALAAVALVSGVRRRWAWVGWAVVLAGSLVAVLAGLVVTGAVPGAEGTSGGAATAAAWAGPGTSLLLLGLVAAALPLLSPPAGALPGRLAGVHPGVHPGAHPGVHPGQEGTTHRRLRAAAVAVVVVLAAGTTGAWAVGQWRTTSGSAAAQGLVARDRGPELPEVAAAAGRAPEQVRTLVLRPAAGTDPAQGGDVVADPPADPAAALGAVLTRGPVDLTAVSSVTAASAAAGGAQDVGGGAPVAEVTAALSGAEPGAGDAVAALGAGFVVLLPPDGEDSAEGTALASSLDALAGLERAADVEGTLLWRVVTQASGAGGGEEAPAPAAPVGALRVVDAEGVPQALDASAAPDGLLLAAGAPGRSLVLAEGADPGWRATLDGSPLTPVAPADAGWAQTFALPERAGTLVVSHDGGWTSAAGPWPWAAGAALLLALLLAVPLPGRRTL